MQLITKYDNPGIITTSNYYAEKDEDTCNSCFTCVDRCNVHAIKIDNERTVISREKCIGCGLCASTCPTGSITMAIKSPAEASPIFSHETEMLQAMGKETGKHFPFE
ncbi:MAG: 4Fe-4S dicluster domain-containing protein [Chloroflexota bacterium]|nr:MAG: 4Fe-4S dicluster domain-containing protein [Chloroflexota bacterium]